MDDNKLYELWSDWSDMAEPAYRVLAEFTKLFMEKHNLTEEDWNALYEYSTRGIDEEIKRLEQDVKENA
jgi:hypothetical protein